LNVHAMTMSAHKLYGPKGVGALVLDKRIEIPPLIMGGGHENGMRAGTENVAGIVGFGAAAQLARERVAQLGPRLAVLREALEDGLRALGAEIFGAEAPRVANTCYFALPGIEGETLIVELDRVGFALASGAACSSANPEPSATLMAMGVAPERARGAVRLSLGKDSTAQHVADFLKALRAVAAKFERMAAMAS
jgi:cysteine desulfurase